MVKVITTNGFNVAFAIGKERKSDWKKLRGGRFQYGFYDNQCSEEAKTELSARCENLIFVKEEDKFVKDTESINKILESLTHC